MGGVLVRDDGSSIKFFFAKLSERHLKVLGANRSKQVIFEAVFDWFRVQGLGSVFRIWGSGLGFRVHGCFGVRS